MGSVAADELPILIVGDVHGDIERLFAALKPYPADRWRTIFLGDLVDYGMFAAGVMRFSRGRPNNDVLLCHHDAAILWALHHPTPIGFPISLGSAPHHPSEPR